MHIYESMYINGTLYTQVHTCVLKYPVYDNIYICVQVYTCTCILHLQSYPHTLIYTYNINVNKKYTDHKNSKNVERILTSPSVAMASAASDITPRVWKANTHNSRVHTQGWNHGLDHSRKCKVIAYRKQTLISPNSRICFSSQMTQNSFSVFSRFRV